MFDTNPALYQKISDNQVDYSEMYRTQETLQLNKRLRKTRNVLFVCSFAFIAGGIVFTLMPNSSFTATNLYIYIGLAALMVFLGFYSIKRPFFSILTAFIACLGVWGLEIFLSSIDSVLIESTIHKLFIISMLVWRFHPSKEAELIRKELQFS